jgi:hypothetical protein
LPINGAEIRRSHTNVAVSSSVTSLLKSGHQDTGQRIVLKGTEDRVKSKAQAVRNFTECLKYLAHAAISNFPVDVTVDALMFGSSDYMWMIINRIYEHVGRSRSVDAKIQKMVNKRSQSAPPRMLQPPEGATRKQTKIEKLQRRLGVSKQIHQNVVNSSDTRQRVSHERLSSGSHSRKALGVVKPENGSGPPVDDHSVLYSKRHDEMLMKEQKKRIQSLDKNRLEVKLNKPAQSPYPFSGPAAGDSRINSMRQERFRARIAARKYRITKHLVEQSVDSHNKSSFQFSGDNATVTAIARQLALQRLQNAGGDNRLPASSNVNKEWESSTVIQRNDDKGTASETRQGRQAQLARQQQKNAISPPRRMTPVKTAVPATTGAPSGFWLPPAVDPIYARGLISSTPVPVMTLPQQNAIREWLLSLGLNVRDGEGGFYSHGHSAHTANVVKLNPNVYSTGDVNHRDPVTAFTQHGSNFGPYYGQYNVGLGTESSINRHFPTSSLAPTVKTVTEPLPLAQDRLRNGELLCDLVCLLEPTVAVHTNLSYFIKRQPKTLRDASENIERALWLLRLRRSPPIPLHYLFQVDGILKATKDLLWGLLWEIMQAYPSSIEVPQSFMGNNAIMNNSQQRGSISHYSRSQRRQLDITLVRWLGSLGILNLFSGGLSMPSTVHALEGPIRDGTLLCILLEYAFQRYIRHPSINKSPHTFAQCIDNVRKCLQEVRLLLPQSNLQYLDSNSSGKLPNAQNAFDAGCESIVRGDWNVIFGLLKELYECHCKQLNITPSTVPASESINGDVAQRAMSPNVPQPVWQGNVVHEEMQRHKGNSNLVTPSSMSAPQFQPKLRLDGGLNGGNCSGDSPSSGDKVPFMNVEVPPAPFDSRQEGFPHDAPRTSVNGTETDKLAQLRRPLNGADANSLPDAGAQLSVGRTSSKDKDLYPGRYSQSIANVFNSQCESLSSAPKSASSYSAHDLTRNNDPALEHILGPVYTRGLGGYGPSAGASTAGSSRNPSPATSLLKEIDGILSTQNTLRSDVKTKGGKQNSLREGTEGDDIIPGRFILSDASY